MQKRLLLVLLLLSAGFVVGCASGYQYTKQEVCPGAVAQNNGKLSSAYANSEFSGLGIGDSIYNSTPYQGAPVYVVNGGADIYGGRGRTDLTAGNGIFGAHRPSRSDVTAGYPGTSGAVSTGAVSYANNEANAAGNTPGYSNGSPAYAAGYGHSTGLFGVGRGFGGWGPFRRGNYARQAMRDYNSGAYNYSSQNYNPYPGNTPTRAPRDFLAPNPPNIGP